MRDIKIKNENIIGSHGKIAMIPGNSRKKRQEIR